MRDLVIRGPREYPGASMVQFEDGSTQTLVSRTIPLSVRDDADQITEQPIKRPASSNRESVAHPSGGRERNDTEWTTDQSTLHRQESVPALAGWRYLASQPATYTAQTKYDGAQGEGVARGEDYSHALRKLVSNRVVAP
jgi:hypothetical protein